MERLCRFLERVGAEVIINPSPVNRKARLRRGGRGDFKEHSMPKTTLSFYLHIIAIAVIVVGLNNYLSSRTPDRAEGSPSIISGDSSSASGLARNDNKETVYDRVMRTGVIG